jgi:hypothetical protein
MNFSVTSINEKLVNDIKSVVADATGHCRVLGNA